MGLANNIGNAKLLQVHGDQHRGRQIVTDGDDGTVQIPDPQGLQHFLILGITHDRMGHISGDLLHKVRPDIQDQDLRAQLAQLPGKGRAKAAKANDCIGFHKLSPYPIKRFVWA